jgi:hypothetical protein
MLAVRFTGDSHCVVAARPAAAGDPLLQLVGTLRDVPSRHSVQVGPGEHLVAAEGAGGPVWQYLNHSCAPNAVLAGRALTAAASIAAGDEVTFDYETTEDELAVPFRCRCGHCPGRTIRGRMARGLPAGVS